MMAQSSLREGEGDLDYRAFGRQPQVYGFFDLQDGEDAF